MRRYFLWLLCVTVVGLTGCHSGVSYNISTRKISIVTEPAMAKVYKVNPLTNNRTFLGTTPLLNQSVLVIVRAKGRATPECIDSIASQIDMVRVIIEKEGYRPYEGNLATREGEVTTHTIELEKE